MIMPKSSRNQDIMTRVLSTFPNPKLKQRTPGLTVRILKELTSPSSFQWNFRESYASLAKRVGADEETVRLTLKRAVEEGAVKGWRIVVNPHLFGQQLRGLQLDVDNEERKTEAISQLKLVEGVLLILDFHGKGMRIAFYYSNDNALDRKVKLIKSLCRFNGDVPHWYTDLPVPEMRLRPIDWSILQILLKDPRMEILPIAQKLGVSTRTVSRRLRLMTESHVAYLIPVRDVRKSRGVLVCYLVTCSTEGQRLVESEIAARGHQVDFVYSSLRNHFLITILADNLAYAEDLLSLVRSIKGVSKTRMDIMKEFIFVDDWLDETVQSIISNSGYSPA